MQYIEWSITHECMMFAEWDILEIKVKLLLDNNINNYELWSMYKLYI